MIQVANTVMIPREEYDSLVQQRAELLALLSEIKPLLERELQVEFDAANERAIKWALPKIDAAIAKVKPYQGLPTTGTT